MENKFEKFGIMVDCSRNGVMTVPALKKWIDIISDVGFNTLFLYTEDTYQVENNPYFGHLRGRYSFGELAEIEDYTVRKGLSFVPCIQTLAHLNAIFHWKQYENVRDCNDILLAGDQGTYGLIEDMFRSLAGHLKTRVLNIGMDEAYMLGRGKYTDIHGECDRMQILVDHLKKVCEIARKYGFRLMMWGDMFIRIANNGDRYGKTNISDDVKKQIPDIVDIIYWDYYSTDYNRYDSNIRLYKEMKDDTWFAGGLWTWTGFAPHNAYSVTASRAALQACMDNGIKNVMFTVWQDNGCECSRFAILPSLFYVAELARGVSDESTIKREFEEKFGIAFDDFCQLDFKGTPNDYPPAPCNADKFMLYSDVFMGQFDSAVEPGAGERYLACAEKLQKLGDHGEFGTLFRSAAKLAEVLSVKYDLGVRTRSAYTAQDKQALMQVAADYDRLIKLLEEFYTLFRARWMEENKPHGFDVQDIRLGGLMQRIKHCRETLRDYTEEKISSIPELEEPVLCKYDESDGRFRRFNRWAEIVTANVM